MRSTNIYAVVISAALLCSGPALALGDNEQNNTNKNNPVANGGAGGAGGDGGQGGDGGRGGNGFGFGGDADQRQNQGQGQGQYQKQGNANEINVDGDDVDQEYYNVNTPSSAGNNVWDCTQSINVGVSVLLGGGSVGIPQDNETCEAGKLLDMARSTGSPHLIDMAERNLRNVLQDKIGYLETKAAIQEKEQVGTYIEHNDKPSWCPSSRKFGMSDSDARACGLDG